MQLRFTKMHGLGNDFVVIDAVNQTVSLSRDQVRWLADRHRGIGCDQLLLVEPATDPAADFRYRIYNADGGEVEQCGNGARCFMRFVHDQGLTARRALTVQTLAGPIALRLEDDGQVTVDMGPPRLEPAAIPFQAPARAPVYSLEVEGQEYTIGALSMGNPHAVLTVEDIDRAPVATLGPRIEHHPRFPNRVNVGFMQIDAPDHIHLRVFERGVGETRACGTGACAAAVAGRLQGRLDARVRVSLPGGDLVISWSGEDASVFMTGPAVSVFEGTLQL
ncbi:diaminopimelate epimerase [Thiohalobacter sp. COW1]|uniref:diaminopimelate epimerase n=1 Tax=Thiohalobacter sp. COW1 TaxID=2795687 RepID=UPI0019164DC3|nr:diaminopimelate epimerase [Thiohalobacter sp. COW1]BCO32331.1 diaminopimelate epimerase [Thiohalobacter sp. COW1]